MFHPSTYWTLKDNFETFPLNVLELLINHIIYFETDLVIVYL